MDSFNRWFAVHGYSFLGDRQHIMGAGYEAGYKQAMQDMFKQLEDKRPMNYEARYYYDNAIQRIKKETN